jgi:pimeloyl-ACP methyl ester carboxylesterase
VFTPAHRGGSGPPLVCLHGFTGTWRIWRLVLPRLERAYDVLAPTLAGHAGGPPLTESATAETVVEGVERAMDAAGFETAHIVGNSLGGYIALRLAARGRAESVVALAPAGGWPVGHPSLHDTMDYFRRMQELLPSAASNAAFIASTQAGRRAAVAALAERGEHIPPETVIDIIRGAAGCSAAAMMIERGSSDPWTLDASRIECPVRIVWGTADRLLPWPIAATRYRHDWLPHADWVELDGVGHCPQIDIPLETTELILGFH